MSTPFEITLRRLLQNKFDDKSTLVQVIAWCRLAPSHYLDECKARYIYISPSGVTTPQCVHIAIFDFVFVITSHNSIHLIYSPAFLIKLSGYLRKCSDIAINLWVWSHIKPDVLFCFKRLQNTKTGVEIFTSVWNHKAREKKQKFTTSQLTTTKQHKMHTMFTFLNMLCKRALFVMWTLRKFSMHIKTHTYDTRFILL